MRTKYCISARGIGKSQMSIKRIMDLVADGYEIVFPQPTHDEKYTEALDKIREHVYDYFAINESIRGSLEEQVNYFRYMYEIEPYLPKPTFVDADAWLKANPHLESLLAPKNLYVFIEIKEKENVD